MTNAVLGDALEGVIAKLREGKGFGRPLAETGLYPRLATQMILVGEESGRLEEMLRASPTSTTARCRWRSSASSRCSSRR